MDSSECSFTAANYAASLAKTHGASIILIQVVEIHPYSSTIPFYMTTRGNEAFEKDVRVTAEDWFAKIEKPSKKQDVIVKHHVLLRSKSVIESIVSYADKNKVDLIVIGTMGLTGFKKLLLGSVARGVIDHAHCPVLLVR